MNRTFFASLIVAAAAVLSCGPIESFPEDEPPLGRVCYSDDDCVPNDCCGEGTGATHIADAPDCRGVRCSGACDPSMIDCGCAIPICRNSRCQAAVRETCL